MGEFIDYGSLYMQTMASVSSGVTAIESKATLIVALTETGSTARMLAKYRPQAPILAITASESTSRQMLLLRGVVSVLTASFVGTDSVIQKALATAKEMGIAKKGDVAG